MSVRAEILHTWADGSTTHLRLSTDSAPHPDLMDELVSRIHEMWREVCAPDSESK